ncbi:MAG: hypothetical protein O8C66_02870 [Candidatus Methanoperedens sp.]|nr:hypothetical protein [Candidatus Methanoperedens sp.]MCZ7369429.1 hypothetical protein [Candidatus Methanoperedens sp.]
MNFDPRRLTKKQILLILVFVIEGAVAFGLWSVYSAPGVHENETQLEKTQYKYVYKPSVSIGCSRVEWKDAEIHLSASTNMRSPSYQWLSDNKTLGTERNLVYTFKTGENSLILKAASGNDSAQDEIEIIIVDSTDGISAENVAGSMINERVFLTKFKDAVYYVDGVSVILDEKDMGSIPECRKLTVSGLYAGAHTWKAMFRGKDIGSGSFSLESLAKLKITRVDIAGSYRAGDTVDGKIFLQNAGTVPVKDYAIKTLVVNHNFEWMGDISKKEFTDTFDYELKPGDSVQIPVQVKIPEKVSGIRPVGDYSITIQLLMNNQVEETQLVKTVVV